MYEELSATLLCHDTRHSCHEKTKTVGSKLCCNITKVCLDRIQEKAQRTGRDRKQNPAIKTEDSVATKLSMSQQSDQFGLEIWGYTTLS